jgi:hypothetical protein
VTVTVGLEAVTFANALAVMVTTLVLVTALDTTGIATLLCPPVITAVAGTGIEGSLLVRFTVTDPPAGTAWLRLTVMVTVCPPETELGNAETDEMSIDPAGATVSVAQFVELPRVALMTETVGRVTPDVPTAKVAVFCPAGMMTLAGTETPVPVAVSATDTASGRIESRVTVPVTAWPDATELGTSATPETDGGLIVSVVLAGVGWLNALAVSVTTFCVVTPSIVTGTATLVCQGWTRTVAGTGTLGSLLVRVTAT